MRGGPNDKEIVTVDAGLENIKFENAPDAVTAEHYYFLTDEYENGIRIAEYRKIKPSND